MKTTEELFDDYLDVYNDLKRKNELWRLKVSPNEFLEKVKSLNEEVNETKNGSPLELAMRIRKFKIEIAKLVSSRLTNDEIKKQFEAINKATQITFELEKESIKNQINKIESPITSKERINIYKWIGRNQIAFSDLPNHIQEEFKQTSKYQNLLNRGLIK
jgi:hypothetical protein